MSIGGWAAVQTPEGYTYYFNAASGMSFFFFTLVTGPDRS